MRNILLTTVFIFSLFPSFSEAKAVFCVNCSNSITQAIENLTGLSQLEALRSQVSEAATQTQQQITMVTQNIEQFENMVKNTVNLPMDIYNSMQTEYKRLQSLYKEMQVHAGNLDGIEEAYNVLFPQFGTLSKDYNTNWTMWSQQVDKSNQALMEITGIQLSDLINDDSNSQDKLNQLLSKPEGRMEAIQAGNQISAMQMQEMRELRTLMATALQQQAIQASKQEKLEQTAREQNLRLMPPKGGFGIDMRNIKNHFGQGK